MMMQLNSVNVLLIESDSQQTELYSELIREVANCQIDIISRGDAALDWIGRSNYQLVVIGTSSMTSDSASKTDALSVLERIKRFSPVTSVILVSDRATIEEAVAAIRLGAEDYLKRPFNVEVFQLAIKRGLDRKEVFGENEGASSYFNLINSCQMISASLEQGKIFRIIQSYFIRELGCAHSAFYMLQGGANVATRLDSDPAEAPLALSMGNDRAMEEVLDIALQASNPLPKMRDGNQYYRFIERGQLTPGLFIFKFHCAGTADYFFVGLSPNVPPVLDDFESRLRMLRTQIEVTGKNIESYQGVQSLVYVDDATGLYNTRYLNYILDREIGHANTSHRSFAILFIDADKFKAINDVHGHLVGTKILNELGSHLKKYVRDTDTVFRYGGDEFVAVLSPCDLATAETVANRIRQSVEQRSFLEDEGLNIHFTVSIGVALFPDHADSKKAVIDAADHAMYHAKRTTRNSVFIAPLSKAKDQENTSAKAK